MTKSAILIIIMTVLLITISSCQKQTTSSNENSGTSQQPLSESETVVSNYLKSLDFDGGENEDDSLRMAKKYTQSPLYEALSLDENFTSVYLSMLDVISEHCKLSTLSKTEIQQCTEVTQIIKQSEEKHSHITINTLEPVETSENENIIKANYNLQENRNGTPINITASITFFLNKTEDGWKIYDYIGRDGKRKSENYMSTKEEFSNQIQNNLDLIAKQKKAIQERKDSEKLINNIQTTINSVFSKMEVKEVNLNNYQNTSNWSIEIQYYFEPDWLEDDYLKVQKEASSVFSKMFPLSNIIQQVDVIAMTKETDDYGYPKDAILSESTMLRPTWKQVNWAGFESEKLNKIADVKFYGESYVKWAEDWEKQRTNINCESAEFSCQYLGECDELSELIDSEQCDDYFS